MCEYSLVGRLPLQEDVADVASAGYHLVCAAAASDARALRDVRALCHGLPASEVLVGVKMRESDVKAMEEKWLHIVTQRLAHTGDVSSMIEMADADAKAGRCTEGADWLRAAVETYDAATNEERTNLNQYGCARYQLLQKFAELLKEGGKSAEAAAAYEDASEAAMNAGKAKMAMKLSALAEELAGDDE